MSERSGATNFTVGQTNLLAGLDIRVFERMHTDAVTTWSIASDGRRIATGSKDKTVRISDARTAQPLANPLQHHDIVNSISFSPDGLRLVTSAVNREIRVWDAQTGQPLIDWLVSSAPIEWVAFTEDSATVVTSGEARFPIATVSGRAPNWLPDIAEAIVGIRLNAGNVFETINASEALRIARAHRNTGGLQPLPTWVRDFLRGLP